MTLEFDVVPNCVNYASGEKVELLLRLVSGVGHEAGQWIQIEERLSGQSDVGFRRLLETDREGVVRVLYEVPAVPWQASVHLLARALSADSVARVELPIRG
jgi:hypothetical protein